MNQHQHDYIDPDDSIEAIHKETLQRMNNAREEAQRRYDDNRRDWDREDEARRQEERRQDMQRQEERRQDMQRQEERRQDMQRQGRSDADLDEKSYDVSESQAAMQSMRERHYQDIARHREQEAAKDAQTDEPSFYPGGFVDLQGNLRSERDVDAIMKRHEAAGGHQAQRERFGLVNNGANVETLTGRTDNQADNNVETLTGRTDNQAYLDLLHTLNAPGAEDKQEKTDWVAYVGLNEKQAEELSTRVNIEMKKLHVMNIQKKKPFSDITHEPVMSAQAEQDEYLYMQRLEGLNDQGKVQSTEQEQPVDWQAVMDEAAKKEKEREREQYNEGLTQTR